MILVTGASGNVGGDLIPLLLSKQSKVRVLVRDPRKAAGMGPGVDVAVGDLSKPETLAGAMKGVEAVFLMSTEHGGTEHVSNAVAAARAARVRRVVYLSSLSACEPTTAIGKWHKARERVIEDAGLDWTFLRPGAFMANALRWAPTIKGQGMVFAMNADRPTRPIDSTDMAAVAAVTLTHPGHNAKAYPLVGTEPQTGFQMVETLARVIGKPVKCVNVPAAAAREGMTKAGMPPALADAVVELMVSSWESYAPEAKDMVQKLTNRSMGTFEGWCLRHAEAFT